MAGGGLIASYEKFVMDCETLQQVVHYLKPVPVSDADIAVDAIREVGPRGHFFGAEHTQERYETAFYSPFLSDWRNYESWALAGGVETPQRANMVWKQILAEFEPPPLDAGNPRRAAGFRGPPGARGRRADGFLSAAEQIP
jgi:trimethylamine--corrinoid protein Co-methyltransferase